MKIDLILIGGELIHGKRSDLNGPELAKQLRPLGHQINSIVTVPDDFTQIIETIETLTKNSERQLIITSGGMGPTADDITKSVIARYFAAPLVDSNKAREVVTANYKRHGRIWESAINHYQMIPTGSIPLNNPTGHAPGLLFCKNNLSILSLPGVPHEFSSILSEQLAQGLLPQEKNTRFFTIKTKEIAEEVIFEKLCPGLWDVFEKYGPVSSLPHPGGVEISVETEESNFPKLRAICDESPLVDYIWQYGETPIHQFIIEKLIEKKLTIAVAESCTGGLFSHLLTDVSGSSNAFLGAVICYSNEAKINLLNVKNETIDRFTEVSEQAAKEMAEGARNSLNSDFGISFTGYAGPTGGSDKDPVGTVYIGLSSSKKTEVFRYTFFGTRSLLKQRFVQYGFYRLLDRIKVS